MESHYTVEVVNQIKLWFLSNAKFSNETGFVITNLPAYTIREHLQPICLLFICLNAIIFVVGLVLNCLLLIRIVRGRLYRDRVMLYLTNSAVCGIIQLTFVMPYTLCIIFFEHWVLGNALCYAGPWGEHIPVSVTTLTYLVLALHRHRQIMSPLKEPFSARLSLVAIWITSAGVNLPLSIFHRYIDLQFFWQTYVEPNYDISLKGNFFSGVHMCAQAVKQSLRDFARASFFIFYAAPFVITAFLYVRASAELSSSLNRRLECAESLEEMAAMAPGRLSLRRTDRSWNGADDGCVDASTEVAADDTVPEDEEQEIADCPPVHTAVATTARLQRERSVQHCLIIMTSAFALAWTPVRVLSLSNPLLVTDKSSGEAVERRLDVTYLVFLLFTHLATCVNPILLLRRLPHGSDLYGPRRSLVPGGPATIELRRTSGFKKSDAGEERRTSGAKTPRGSKTAEDGVLSPRGDVGGLRVL